MSFEAFPAEAVEQFNDPGPYYVREGGKLRSPPGMGPRTKLTQGLMAYTQQTLISAKPTSCSENTPRKLYDMMLDFVAANVALVESLVGFPEVVGRQLFDVSLRLGSVDLQAMRLFSESYRDAVLQSIQFAGSHIAVKQHLDYMAIFTFLSELDVGGCCLGDDHEMLTLIANYHSLKRLGLAMNNLTDVGIQRLTAPLRIMGRGPRNLTILNLAGNPGVSDKSASLYLTAFISLKAIDLSGCSVNSIGLNALKSKLRMKKSPTDVASALSVLHPPIQTIGWASSIVEEWLSSSTTLTERAKHKTDQTSKATHFYGRASKRMENATKGILPRPSPPTLPIIRLIADPSKATQSTSGSLQITEPRANRPSFEGFSKKNGKPDSCCEEGGELQGVHESTSPFDEELIGQYALSSHKRFRDLEQPQNPGRQRTSNVEAESRGHDNQPSARQDPDRVDKPPPKKRIKLRISTPKGFQDLNHDPEVVTKQPETKSDSSQSSAGQLISDKGRPRDEEHATQQRVLKQRRPPLCCSRKNNQQVVSRASSHQSCKCRTESRESTYTDQPTNRNPRSTLWTAMHSKDWG